MEHKCRKNMHHVIAGIQMSRVLGAQEYWSMKEKIVDTEQLILRVLGFDIETFQAYR